MTLTSLFTRPPRPLGRLRGDAERWASGRPTRRRTRLARAAVLALAPAFSPEAASAAPCTRTDEVIVVDSAALRDTGLTLVVRHAAGAVEPLTFYELYAGGADRAGCRESEPLDSVQVAPPPRAVRALSIANDVILVRYAAGGDASVEALAAVPVTLARP